jgi:hypothetical protein
MTVESATGKSPAQGRTGPMEMLNQADRSSAKTKERRPEGETDLLSRERSPRPQARRGEKAFCRRKLPVTHLAVVICGCIST